MKRKITDVRKILVVTLSNLGDAVLTLPVVQSLLEAYPDCTMDVMAGSPGASEIFSGDARICRVLLYDKKASLSRKWAQLLEIRGGRYDLILDLRRSLFGLLGGARYRNTYFSLLPGNRFHRVLRHLYVLKNIIPFHHTKSFLWERNAPESAHLFSFLRQAEEKSQGVVLAAVGSKSDLKKWPPLSYAALLDRLALEQNCRIVLIGDKMMRSMPKKWSVR